MTSILIVEDDLITATGIKKMVERWDHQVDGIVDTGEKAISAAKEHRPDIVLMDIRLKDGMDGIEAARHIREHISIPILYLTAYADRKTVERAVDTEPYSYLLKPFQERELRAAIEVALHRHQRDEQLRQNKEELDRILESTGDGICVIDTDFRVHRANKTYTALIGSSEKEARGKQCHQVFPTTLCGTPNCPLTRILEDDTAVEYVMEKKTGEDQHVHSILTATPYKDDEGQLLGIIVTVKDITGTIGLLTDTQKETARRGRKTRAMGGKTPCAILSWDVHPAIRKELAEHLVDRGLTQSEAAEHLGVSRAAVSQYLSKKRGALVDFDEPMQQEFDESARRIIDGADAIQEVCRLCQLAKKTLGIADDQVDER
ncbi:MAG: response regulator [Thermoplasmatota archaeon]